MTRMFDSTVFGNLFQTCQTGTKADLLAESFIKSVTFHHSIIFIQNIEKCGCENRMTVSTTIENWLQTAGC